MTGSADGERGGGGGGGGGPGGFVGGGFGSGSGGGGSSGRAADDEQHAAAQLSVIKDLRVSGGAVDWWDVSQVDGWTLPYRVDVYGDCSAAKKPIDCSSLALSACPDDEDLGGNAGRQSLALRDPRNASRLVGCYSPCAKLTYSQWNQGFGNTPESPQARDFCCPTPPISPARCSAGPVASARYVRTVHALCPSVYGYAYDDGVGLAQCPAGTRYKVTFYCPK